MIAKASQTVAQNREVLVRSSGLTKRYGSWIRSPNQPDGSPRRGVWVIRARRFWKDYDLRMLLGLIRPTSGTVQVLGKKPGTPAGLQRNRSTCQASAFYPYLSGQANLHAMASSYARIHRLG